jgi:hypothetical protein
MGRLLPNQTSGRQGSSSLDPERIMAEFAAVGVIGGAGAGEPGSPESLDSNGMPTRYVPENDKPPCYADVVALCKSVEAEALLRQLQIQLLQQHEKQRKQQSGEI